MLLIRHFLHSHSVSRSSPLAGGETINKRGGRGRMGEGAAGAAGEAGEVGVAGEAGRQGR